MKSVLLVALGFAAGLAVGFVFFGGLWWTARRLAVTTRPGLVVAASLLLRLGVLAGVLVVLARADALLLVGAVVGVVAARIALTNQATRGGGRDRIVTGMHGGR